MSNHTNLFFYYLLSDLLMSHITFSSQLLWHAKDKTVGIKGGIDLFSYLSSGKFLRSDNCQKNIQLHSD